jgi:hypothetical protein
VPSPVALLYLIKKAFQAGPSNASLRYDEAMRFGSPADRIRERLRKSVRWLIGSWILLTISAMLLLDHFQGGPEDRNLLIGAVIALVALIPCWFLYKLVRFAMGH